MQHVGNDHKEQPKLTCGWPRLQKNERLGGSSTKNITRLPVSPQILQLGSLLHTYSVSNEGNRWEAPPTLLSLLLLPFSVASEAEVVAAVVQVLHRTGQVSRTSVLIWQS